MSQPPKVNVRPGAGQVQAQVSASLGALEPLVARGLERLAAENVLRRIRAGDYTVWKPGPGEIVNRLGWLDSADRMPAAVPEITGFADEVRAAGFTRALLLGMGGSSLAPEMFAAVFGVAPGYLELGVLDSTDPGAVLDYSRRCDPAATLYLISSKSGGTVETLSFMKFFYNQALHRLGAREAGRHFAAITDPGSSLAATAERLGFRKIFLGDPDIGGRYSALSHFGLVPAALAGVDIVQLLSSASRMARREGLDPEDGGAWLGTLLGEAVQAGRDKLTLILAHAIRPFGAWAEQLLAESTGKEGTGIVPVDREVVLAPEAYGADRLFVHLALSGDDTCAAEVKSLIAHGHPVVTIRIADPYALGGECFRWEMATAVAGHFLKINPFDQPNVEAAKKRARAMVEAYRREGRLSVPAPSFVEAGIAVDTEMEGQTLQAVLRGFLESATAAEAPQGGRSYVAIQAYLQPTAQTDAALQALRTRIQEQYRLATTVGFGPRFLHSTGQLHKGDGGHGWFIQITSEAPEDAPIPDEAGRDTSSLSFQTLKTAQALGDGEALKDAGRHVLRVHLRGADMLAGLRRLREVLPGEALR